MKQNLLEIMLEREVSVKDALRIMREKLCCDEILKRKYGILGELVVSNYWLIKKT